MAIVIKKVVYIIMKKKVMTEQMDVNIGILSQKRMEDFLMIWQIPFNRPHMVIYEKYFKIV